MQPTARAEMVTARTHRLRSVAIAGMLLAVALGMAHAKNTLDGVTVRSEGQSTTITLTFSEAAKYKSFIVLENPYRLLLDLSDRSVFSEQRDMVLGEGLVTEARFEYAPSNLKVKELMYIIFDLTDVCTVTAQSKQKMLTLTLARVGGAALDPGNLPKAAEIRNLSSCVDIGLANIPYIQLALDEVKLAERKLWEAYRALYPALSLKYEQTRGEADRLVGTPAFDEVKYGVQLNHPLYYSGKLRATFRQAELNHTVAKLKYEDITLNTVFEIAKAYYNLAKNQQSAAAFAELLKDVAADVTAADKLYKNKLLTKIDYLNVTNFQKQIDYNASSLEKDVLLAKLALLQLLYIKKETQVYKTLEMPYEPIEVTLVGLTRTATLRRPDLKMNQLQVEIQKLGTVIGRSSNGFKVDFSGFFGRSAGAYTTEPLILGDDYSVALQLSKPFGGSTVGTSFLFDHTSPQIGQSSRTESKTGIATIGILDNIKGYSDELESDIEFRRSQIDFQESINTVDKDVRESYFNLEKAKLQLTSSKNEVDLAKEEVVATRSKKELNMATIGDYVEAKLRLANAHKAYFEALAFYNTSAASVYKSTGQLRELGIPAAEGAVPTEPR